MNTAPSSRRVLMVSLIVGLIDVVTNLVVALLTGSAVIFAAMAQGLADSVGSVLLVIGERRSRHPRTARHPFGYAREAFFWGLLSAVAMLVVGAGLSGWRGYEQLVHPDPIESPWLGVIVISIAIATNSYSVGLSVRKLVADSGSLRAALRRLDQPLIKNALLRDSIGTFTSVVGLAALLLYVGTGLLLFDALGALAASAMMVVASVLLMTQARALITGQALPESVQASLRASALATQGVSAVNRLDAVYSGTSQVLVDADLDLKEDLDTGDIEALLDELESRLRGVLPKLERIRVILNSPQQPARFSIVKQRRNSEN